MNRLDLPTFGRPTIASLSGRSRASCVSSGSGCSSGSSAKGSQRFDQFVGAEIVLGRERERFAEAQAVGVGNGRLLRAAFALVGDEDHGLAGAAQRLGDDLVARRHAVARIEGEEADVRVGNRRHGLRRHARGKAAVGAFLEPRRVDQLEGQRAERRIGFAPVARDAGRVVDERQPLAREPVESVDLPTLGRPYDGDGQGHGE